MRKLLMIACLIGLVVTLFSVLAWALPTARAAPDNMSVALLTNKINSVALVPMVALAPAWTMVPKVLSLTAASIVPATSNRMIAQHLRGCDLLPMVTEMTVVAFYPFEVTRAPTSLALYLNSPASPNAFAEAWAEITDFWTIDQIDQFVYLQDLPIPNNSGGTLVETTSFWNTEITGLHYGEAIQDSIIVAASLYNGRNFASYNGKRIDTELAIMLAGATTRGLDHNGLILRL